MNIIPFRSYNLIDKFSKYHPDVRILVALFYSVYIALSSNVLVILGVLLFQLFVAMLGKIKIAPVLKRLLITEPFMIILVLFIPFFNGTEILYTFYIDGFKIIIYKDKLLFTILVLVRIMSIFIILMLYFSSISFSEFVSLRILPPIITSTLIIMLNFIPEFFIRNNKTVEAQKLRGLELIHSKKSKIKYAGYLIGNSLIISLDRSERLYEGMLLRGYSGKIEIERQKISKKDFGFILLNILGLVFIYFTINLSI
ncbi:MAG: energy-coupling factor transporter transmembrane component T family protein [Promethearchaeota archaeon]